jgi:hypothetical protein
MFGLEKKWQFAAIVAEEALVAAAVADFGYLGYAFAYAWVREGGTLRKFRHITPMGLGATVAGEPDADDSAFAVPFTGIRYDARALAVHAPGWRAEVAFAGDAAPLDAAWEIPGGGPHRTRKRMGERAEGTLTIGGRAIKLDGLGLKDWSRGLPARETAWRWVAGAGRVGGRVIAWNLRTGFDDPTEVENAVWLDGAPVAVGRAIIEPGPAWRIEAGPLRLAFRPDGAHAEDLDLGLLASRYGQPWGTFEGTWDGAPVVGHGVTEDHWARW